MRDGTLRFRAAGGVLPAGDYAIPFQALSCILGGPGSSATHDAIRAQSRRWADPKQRVNVDRRMYARRFGS